MLESTVKQLAGADRESKLDAYTMVVRALQASNNLPDRIALQSKMSLFVQFIQRDIVAKTPTGVLDSALINKALTLLDTFLFFPAIASTIPNDFGVFILDHFVRSLEEQSTPKDVARRLMHIVAIQDFSPRAMTSDRVRRLVNALHNIDGHLRGKSIVVGRMRIYRRLMTQARAHMSTHTDWLNGVFTDMLSNVRDIKDSAIRLGTDAAFVFGKEKILSRKVMELLETSIEEMTYIEWYHDQLSKMAKGQEKAAVPRIWSVIVLLLRRPLDRWRFSNRWLHLLQTCFNCSDPQCNKEANFAWNRFVYTTNLEEQSFNKRFSTLYTPLVSQLSKPNISDQKREVVLGGLCNLYYYAFKPSTNSAHFDTYWDISVKPLTDSLVPSKKGPEAVTEHFQRLTCILISLLDSSTPRIWNDERIKDSPVAKPEELPAIDPKWIRHNASRVFQVVSPILERQFCDLSDKMSLTHRLWKTLVGSVVLAASKEIKVSVDTATFISEMLSFLLKQWQAGVSENAEEPEKARQFLRSTQDLILTAVEALGLLPWTGKMISLGRLSHFAPVATPSHKPGRNLGDVRSPLQHLFGLLLRLPPGIPDDDHYLDFVRSVFSPFFTSQKSAKARSDLAIEMLQTVPNWTPPVSSHPYGPWVFASENLIAGMNSSQLSVQTTSSSGDTVLGHEYRGIIRLLERGWKETPNLPLEQWYSLHAALASRAVGEVGEPGLAIGMTEPVAKMVRDALPADPSAVMSPKSLQVAIELISTATHPADRHVLEAARRRLWGTAVTGSRTASFDPYDHLYKLVNDILLRLYNLDQGDDLSKSATPLFSEIASFLSRCNPQLVLKSIKNLESGILVWIQDERGMLSGRRDGARAEAIKRIWTTACKIILEGEKPQLENYEQLLCAGFESRHRQIVNITAETWNRVFENATELQYPEQLKTVLLSSQTLLDLVLPGLETASAPSDAHPRFFIDSQDDLGVANLNSYSLRHKPPSSLTPVRSPSPAVSLSFPAKRQLDGTPKKRTRGTTRNTPTARLKHDDSQLHFVAIEPSPSVVANQESQVLTERQKEVRERQKDTAALFTELRSSARPSSTQSGRRRSPRSSAKEGTPERPQEEFRSEQEDFVDAFSSPQRSSPINSTSGVKTTDEQGSQAGDASFVMSEGDERSMLKLVVELDSRRCPLPLSQHPAESPDKGGVEVNGPVLDCITVATPDGTPQRRKSRSPSKKASSAFDVAESPSHEKSERKKRKRLSSKSEPRRKKRRSASFAEDADQVHDSQSSTTTNNADSSQGDDDMAPLEGASSPRTRSAKRRNTSEEKDTDTELESQLVAEQQAASRSQSQQVEDVHVQPAAAAAAEPSVDDVEMDTDDLPHGQALAPHEGIEEPLITPATAEKPSTPAAKDIPMLGSLSDVLAQLRSTALSRDEVYKMEDVLMDIKRELYEAERRGRS
ncbi:hypothetical protein SODALDRAFT_267108 [Sodiomyces alkalinus F11]|uniref:Telomere-associated protein Rif1 N-terminal domain-containing protein n=1 Tax=Sodiomyces alkalinus (strain CBS 110278 / VKM F-3762 / F11) TaxID=1314773 RepID=A0A3N2QA54_SODAK|nr:hypothetical protein SODALDRAFT_267108 [Sodiomyces alkalinus F11]ROT43631.1 hypothetical protein SODALDRAFT_267108 [Sodiomyces alkalinus F11]